MAQKRKHDTDNGHYTIIEGKAQIKFHGPVNTFYNPAQEFNRDLTVSVLRILSTELKERRKQKRDKRLQYVNENSDGDSNKPKKPFYPERTGIHICDALSASGLRAIRFAKEVNDCERIVANDFSDQAFETIKKNIESNNVSEIVHASHADASNLLYDHRSYNRRFDAVDLDPYGSPAIFLDAAIQSVADDGILMVTCTDVATMCGSNAAEACLARYGAMSISTKACHEMALRILLQCLDTHAARYQRYIVPLMSLSIDFYLRVFIRIKTGANIAKENALHRALVLQCTQCHSFVQQSLVQSTPDKTGRAKYTGAIAMHGITCCEFCHGKMIIGGPLWSGRLHDHTFVKSVLNSVQNTPDEDRLGTASRIIGMLTLVSEEIPDVFLHHDVPQMTQTLKAPMLKTTQFFSALIRLGYKCSISHISPLAIKTDAPRGVLWQIIKCAREANIANSGKIEPNTPGASIIAIPMTIEVDFTLHEQAVAKSKQDGLVRFQINKGKDMGPKARAKGSVISNKASLYEKRLEDVETKEEVASST